MRAGTLCIDISAVDDSVFCIQRTPEASFEQKGGKEKPPGRQTAVNGREMLLNPGYSIVHKHVIVSLGRSLSPSRHDAVLQLNARHNAAKLISTMSFPEYE